MYNYAYLHWDLVKIKRLKYRQKLSSNSTVTNTYVMISVKTTWQRDSSLLSVSDLPACWDVLQPL